MEEQKVEEDGDDDMRYMEGTGNNTGAIRSITHGARNLALGAGRGRAIYRSTTYEYSAQYKSVVVEYS